MNVEHQPSTRLPETEVRALLLQGRQREATDLTLASASAELRPFLQRLLGDVAMADEAHAATCERIWRGLGKFRWECSLRSWVYIVARREASRCRGRHARARLQETTLSAAERMPVPLATQPGLSTTRRDVLDGVRSSLSDEDRDLLVLRVERGLAWKEIAEAFLEEEATNPDAIAREASRLRQRFRAIRVSVAGALADQRKRAEGDTP
jgi:RNA polymerase sigma-70 factor (ECF subfamily)